MPIQYCRVSIASRFGCILSTLNYTTQSNLTILSKQLQPITMGHMLETISDVSTPIQGSSSVTFLLLIITDEDQWIGVETSDIDSNICLIVIGWSCSERIATYPLKNLQSQSNLIKVPTPKGAGIAKRCK